MLTATQEDIMKELYNVFVGEAANLLSEILQKRIYLSVPEVKLLSLNGLNVIEQANLDPILNGTILSTSLKFGNIFSGSAEFVFPTEQIKYVTALCLGEEYTLEVQESSFDDEDFDVVKEIGNIILNSIMGGMGNILEMKLEYDVPQVILHGAEEYGKTFFDSNESHLLLLYVNFSIDESKVIGLILIKFTLESVEFLLQKVDEISRGVNE
ncbi:chemotaxis protein CheC [Psychrobacillus sp.]|uniref:chemotaxis protein CheC n=1 Tax=Psychrobacillus sp. TaxID=1871623 RepID=UPI0028BE964F|nr:chemotaxis protein CheC [Psychrobacillus sp.]